MTDFFYSKYCDCKNCQTKRNTEKILQQAPFFVLPDQVEAFKIANEDGNGEWTMFSKSSPPVDELIWIADKAGGVGFGCLRDPGILFAMCFKSPIPVAWKKRTIETPGLAFE